MAVDNQVSEGLFSKGSFSVYDRPSWSVWSWQLRPGVLEADLAQGGEKAPSPWWASGKALLNFPSLYFPTLDKKGTCLRRH